MSLVMVNLLTLKKKNQGRVTKAPRVNMLSYECASTVNKPLIDFGIFEVLGKRVF